MKEEGFGNNCMTNLTYIKCGGEMRFLHDGRDGYH